MKTATHDLIENIDLVSEDQFVCDARIPRLIVKQLTGCPSFHLGNLKIENEHYLFGCDLFRQGIFTIPFPACLFIRTELEGVPIPMMVERIALRNGKPALRDFVDGDVPSIIITSFALTNGNPARWLPATQFFLEALTANNHFKIQCSDIIKIANGKSAEAFMHQDIRIAIGSAALLMSKSVDREVVEPSEKVNLARQRVGKPPISTKIFLRLRNVTPKPGCADNPNSRKSPVIHWRRGHIRKWGDRLIPIAPCLVNGDGVEIPTPKDYVFATPTDSSDA